MFAWNEIKNWQKLILETCLSKKTWPVLYSKIQYKMGQNFLDIHKENRGITLFIYMICKITAFVLVLIPRFKNHCRIAVHKDNNTKKHRITAFSRPKSSLFDPVFSVVWKARCKNDQAGSLGDYAELRSLRQK